MECQTAPLTTRMRTWRVTRHMLAYSQTYRRNSTLGGERRCLMVLNHLAVITRWWERPRRVVVTEHCSLGWAHHLQCTQLLTHAMLHALRPTIVAPSVRHFDRGEQLDVVQIADVFVSLASPRDNGHKALMPVIKHRIRVHVPYEIWNSIMLKRNPYWQSY